MSTPGTARTAHTTPDWPAATQPGSFKLLRVVRSELQPKLVFICLEISSPCYDHVQSNITMYGTYQPNSQLIIPFFFLSIRIKVLQLSLNILQI